MRRKTYTYKGYNLSYIDSETPVEKSVLIAHANGFAAGCYNYYIENLSKEYRVVALDFLGHGQSENSLDFRDLNFFRDQLIELIEHLSLSTSIGIGHSLGGASLLRAVYRKPDYFSKIIALDPVILSIQSILYIKFIGNPLAETASKRRQSFKNRKITGRILRRHPIFAKWDDRVLDDYLDSCFKTVNGRLELCCPPSTESKIFQLTDFKSLRQFRQIKTETHIIVPEKYMVCPPASARRITKNNPDSSLSIVKENHTYVPF